VNKLYVIGIGYKPLNVRAKELIVTAEVILPQRDCMRSSGGMRDSKQSKRRSG
jgi:hypothetical protein